MTAQERNNSENWWGFIFISFSLDLNIIFCKQNPLFITVFLSWYNNYELLNDMFNKYSV